MFLDAHHTGTRAAAFVESADATGSIVASETGSAACAEGMVAAVTVRSVAVILTIPDRKSVV